MFLPPNYTTTEIIQEDERTITYRGYQNLDRQRVIIKLLKAQYPTPMDITLLEQDYQISKQLNLEGILKVYCLEKYHNHVALIFEDFSGQTLSDYLKDKKLEIEVFLTIALKISIILAAINAKNVIHKNLSPQNIWISNLEEKVKITNFSLASLFNNKNSLGIPNYFQENLSYVSPEQTGRMNRNIDYRTTFYSLGVIFYEMLTGYLPFSETEPMELIHSHIAKQPVLPHQLDREIPIVISNIIIKLLSKNPEARYQSACGLKFDLENCLKQWKSKGEISEFILAQKDRTNRLQIPAKLYERDREIKQLLDIYKRVSQGSTEIILVSGHSGVGKTSLVNEIRDNIVDRQGYFVSGKFSPTKRDIPYYSIIQALQKLIQQLLTENSYKIEKWRKNILAAVGFNYQTIIDVIPKVELIVGKSAPIIKLSLPESKRRFNHTFQQFINVFTKKEHPLVLFFDDLQWADIDSLKLIQLLVTQPNSKYLLIIGSFRDDEVDDYHPLNLTLNAIKKCEVTVNQIFLRPLNFSSVNQLIADTLQYELDTVEHLSELIFQKTNGNPFFINQILQTLYQSKFLSFDYNQACWIWKLTEIGKIDVTENVANFLLKKINKLSVHAQEVLKIAACIGNFFEIKILSLIAKKSLASVSLILSEAIQEGLLFSLSSCSEIMADEHEHHEKLDSCYFFVHDRIQQAAYSLLPVKQKELIHLEIGRIMIKDIYSDSINENIFEIVNQFNSGINLITQKKERVKLAELNLLAGKKAKATTAYEAALHYFEKAQFALGNEQDIWENYYNIMFASNLALSECQYLRGKFEEAEDIFNLVLRHAKTKIEKAKVYILKINLYTDEVKFKQAIDIGLEAAKLFEISLPQRDFDLVIDREISQIENCLSDKQIQDLSDLPEMTDTNALAIMNIFMSLAASTYFINLKLWTLLMLKMMNLSLKYGNNEVSSFAYSAYGLMIGSAFGNYQAGYEFGKLALVVNQKFNNVALNSKIYFMFGAFINPWINNVSSGFDYLQKSFKCGKETGDPSFSSYASNVLVAQMYIKGDDLNSVLQESQLYSNYVNKVKNTHGIYFQAILQQMILSLQGLTKDIFSWNTEDFNEEKYLREIKDLGLSVCIHFYYIIKIQSFFLFADYNQAQKMAIESEKIIQYSFGLLRVVDHYFYYALTLIALYPQSNPPTQVSYWQLIKNYQAKLKNWANNCPQNFLHKYLLVTAEIARIAHRDLEAMEFYDRAIASARENQYTQDEAIANELTAKFYLSKGRDKIARIYLTDASYAYKKWGATTKVKDLTQQYAHLLVETTTETTNSKSLALDLFTVIKASQTLSGEIMLDKLLEKLMKTLIENAGAQKGFLILEKDGKWSIEAEGAVNSHNLNILKGIPIDSVDSDRNTPILPLAIINYVIRTRENVVLPNAAFAEQFIRDPYIVATQPKSILCTPLLHQGKLSGILYLENNLTTGAFTSDRLEVLKLLSSQAAISLQNAQLYVALQENERRLSQFLEAIPLGVFVTDCHGNPYYANQAAQQILGKGIITNTTVTQLTETYQVYLAGTKQLYPTEQQPIGRALQGERTTIEDMEIHQADKIVPLEVSATPVFDEKGQIVYAIAAFADITERKQAELDRMKLIRELATKNIDLQQAKEALAESNRTLEQKVKKRTYELSQTLEVLKATQAELIFENNLLRSAELSSTFDYQVGGSLPMDAPTYVVRASDRYLYKALQRGEFCYILNPRQMGKSSLMVRMMHQLQLEGFSCGAIDLTRIGSENITAEQWYKGLIVELWRSFGLLKKVNLKTWWNERDYLSPIQQLSQFIEEVLLVEVKQPDDTIPKNLVIFIDEIDSILSLNFSVNEFFSLIRSCYNQRSLNPEYRRLTFAFFGVASPGDLITDHQITPFNIGQAIQLEGFKEHEAQPLLQGLTEKVSNPQTVLKEVLAWTNGQPFLTQKLCQLIRSSSSPIPTNREAEWIANLVQTQIIENWESKDEPQHLRTIRDRLLKSKRSVQLLELYRQILARGEILAVDSPEERELLLSGLVIKQEGTLRIQNRIYKSIFV